MRHKWAALLLAAHAFRHPRPAPPRHPRSALRKAHPTQQHWSDRRSNRAIVSKWRRRPEPDVVYEIDRKCIAKNLPDGADADYLKDVLSHAFGPLHSVEVAPGDVAYIVFENTEDAKAATTTAVRVRSGDSERTLDCEPFTTKREVPRGANRHVVVGNVPYGCSDKLLESVFTKQGCKPLNVRRPKDGVAFLDFEDHASALRASMLAGTRVLGRALRVDWDVVQEPPRRERVVKNATSLASVKRPPASIKRKKETALTYPVESPYTGGPLRPRKPKEAPKPRAASAEARVTTALAHAETARDLAESSDSTTARAAAAAAAAAWQEADALRRENRKLRSRLPRRATWQPAPFEVVLGPGARPRDVVRARVDDARDVEIVVPDGAGAGCVLRVRGALRCQVPRGSYVGAPVAVPLPEGDTQLRVVVAVPAGKGPGDALYIAWPVDVLVPGDRSLLPPAAVALPPPLSDDPPRLAPPAAHQALVAATPDPLLDEAAQLREENADLRRQMLQMRRLLRTTSGLFLAAQDSPLALEEGED